MLGSSCSAAAGVRDPTERSPPTGASDRSTSIDLAPAALDAGVDRFEDVRRLERHGAGDAAYLSREHARHVAGGPSVIVLGQ